MKCSHTYSMKHFESLSRNSSVGITSCYQRHKPLGLLRRSNNFLLLGWLCDRHRRSSTTLTLTSLLHVSSMSFTVWSQLMNPNTETDEHYAQLSQHYMDQLFSTLRLMHGPQSQLCSVFIADNITLLSISQYTQHWDSVSARQWASITGWGWMP